MISIKEIIIVVHVWIIIFDILKPKRKVWNIDFILLLVKFYKEINKLLTYNVCSNRISSALFIKILNIFECYKIRGFVWARDNPIQ